MNDTKDLTFEEVKETCALLRQMGEKTTPQNLAKELGVKKTEMMRFINEHKNHFEMTQWRHKDKYNHVTKEWVIVDNVYADPAYNPDAPEYVERKKGEHIIRLCKIDYYGYIYGCHLAEEPKAWENQDADVVKFLAIPEVKDIIKFNFGGLGDSYEVEFKHAFRKKDAEAVFNAMIAAKLTPCIYDKAITRFEDLVEG